MTDAVCFTCLNLVLERHTFTVLVLYFFVLTAFTLLILCTLGAVIQSIVSLTSSLVVKMLTVLVSTISNSQVAEKNTHIFSAKILVYMPYLMIKVLTISLLTT